jgi:hypothetical protein
MNQSDASPLLEKFMQTQNVQVNTTEFFLNLLLTAFLAFVVARLYRAFGSALSNRQLFSKNFVLLAVITMMIITIVKSSLALSLGLVGALSIVRFRSAIKEPEELVYLFFCIAIGLGLGANQRGITIIAFLVIGGIIIGNGLLSKKERPQNLILTLSSPDPQAGSEDLVSLLQDHSSAASLKRIDVSENQLEASFIISLNSYEQLREIEKALKESHPDVSYTFLDTEGAL